MMPSGHPNAPLAVREASLRPAAYALLPAEVFVALREIEARASVIAADAERQGWTPEATAREFSLLLDRAIGALLSLDAPLEDEAEPRVDSVFERQLLGTGEAEGAPTRLSDLCFPAVFELKHVRTDLLAARTSDDLTAASERASGKLRRAIAFILTATGDTPSSRGAAIERRRANDLAEVASALAVRRLYATFRQSLRRPDQETPEAVLSALRYAAGALATLVSSPEYAAVRGSDRALLRRLHERILSWGKQQHVLEVGLHLLDDVFTSADLLRDINRRQELRAHDQALSLALLAAPPEDAALFFERLSALFGLDDALDAVLAEAKNEAPLPELVPRAIERLRSLI